MQTRKTFILDQGVTRIGEAKMVVSTVSVVPDFIQLRGARGACLTVVFV